MSDLTLLFTRYFEDSPLDIYISAGQQPTEFWVESSQLIKLLGFEDLKTGIAELSPEDAVRMQKLTLYTTVHPDRDSQTMLYSSEGAAVICQICPDEEQAHILSEWLYCLKDLLDLTRRLAHMKSKKPRPSQQQKGKCFSLEFRLFDNKTSKTE